MKKTAEERLRRVLARLEATTERLMATRGYCMDTARVRLLQELVREQIRNEDTDRTTRALR